MDNQNLTSFDFYELSRALENYISENKLAGLVALVYHKDQIVYSNYLGVTNLDSSNPMKRDSLFHIASMTKPMVTVLALILFEEGKFNLDDPITNYVPQAVDLKVYVGIEKGELHTEDLNRDITFRDLLTHTSGISASPDKNHPISKLYQQYQKIESQSIEHVILEKYFKIPLLHQPGEKWAYGYSHTVLGYILEKITQKSLDELIQEKLLNPLNMKETGFYVKNKNDMDHLNQVHTINADKLEVSSHKFFNGKDWSNKSKYVSGSYGLVSTANDYLKFAKMLLNEGKSNGHQFIRPETLTFMTTDHLGRSIPRLGPLSKRNGYGFGVSVKCEKTIGQNVGSHGWPGAFSTNYWIDPKGQTIGILLAQHYPYLSQIFRDFEKLVYDELS